MSEKMSVERFNELMTPFLDYYQKELRPIEAKIWYAIFGEFKEDDFDRALTWHLTNDTDTRFPSPGKIKHSVEAVTRKSWIPG